jgi:hypothetical protein
MPASTGWRRSRPRKARNDPDSNRIRQGGSRCIYRLGESWYETPGAHHAVSRNASATKPAKLLAVFVVDTDDKVLTTPDK